MVDLKLIENRYRLLFETAADAILIMKHGTFVDCNDYALSLFGCSREDLIGASPEKFSPPFQPDGRASHELALKMMGLALQGKPQHFEWLHQRLNGTPIQVEISLNALELEGDQTIQGIIRDVSERKSLQQSLERTLKDTIKTISTIIEMRDPYTAGHQQKVADLSVKIGERLGMDAGSIQILHMAATIHDIGKLRVPAEILNRPGRLDELEFQMIRKHPQIGYEIIKNMNLLPSVAQIVRQHHERYDGSGYPDGLSGDDIKLESRIIAVADTVEAMSSHRPYREALGLDAALLEIENRSGTSFDPRVVEACLDVFKNI